MADEDLSSLILPFLTQIMWRLDQVELRMRRVVISTQVQNMSDDKVDAALAQLEAMVAETDGRVNSAIALMDGLLDLVDNNAASPERLVALTAKARAMRDKLTSAIERDSKTTPVGPSLGPQTAPEAAPEAGQESEPQE